MSDRVRLDTLVKQKMLQRQKAAELSDQAKLAEIDKRKGDKTATAQLFQWCEKTFSDFTLPETGHVLGVSKMAWSQACNLTVYFGDTRLQPGVEYVGMAIAYTGPETYSQPTNVLLLLARSVSAKFEVISEDGISPCSSLEDVQACLLNFVADFGAARLSAVLEKIARGRFAPKH
jgi:hypothetical protein